LSNIPVQSFTTVLSGPQNNILHNTVGISEARQPPQPANIKNFEVIWDTGATNTVITSDIVSALNLQPTSTATTQTPNGPRLCNVYLVDLFLPNKVIFPCLQVIEAIIDGQFNMLIGMDIIGKGDFSVSSHKGIRMFSFRMPSLVNIDYTGKLKIGPAGSTPPKKHPPGRNAPCSCGSGKKYKHCCGRKN
jgi:predicted aspartyl protease